MSCNCPKCSYVAPPKKQTIDLDKLKPGAVLKVDDQYWMICRNHNNMFCAISNRAFGVPLCELQELINDAWTVELVYGPGSNK